MANDVSGCKYISRYSIVRLLGTGGMGEVFLVRDPDSGVEYAAKVLKPELAGRNPDFVKRFLREAEFAKRIRHPNLVAVYESGFDDRAGCHYLLMEYVSGGSLRGLLDAKGRLPVGEAVEITRQIAYGLAAAHQHGVIHRDIKPDNILFAKDGVPKLADLGVAKFSNAASATTHTAAGSLMGTPAYMAPEQLMDTNNADVRSDIYSLGLVFYEMLTGQRPNKDDSVLQLLTKAIKGQDIPDVRELRPEVSASIVQVINVMCTRLPEDRLESVQKVVDVLERLSSEGLDAKLGLKVRRRRLPWTGRRVFRLSARSLIVSFLVFTASMMLVGVWRWWDEHRVVKEFYADYVTAYGVPRGIIPLSPEEAMRRSRSYVFYYCGKRRGARILRFVLTRYNDFLHYYGEDDFSSHERLKLRYREDGSVELATLNGTPEGLCQYRYSGVVSSYDNLEIIKRMAREELVIDSEKKCRRRQFSVDTLDDNGIVTQREFKVAFGFHSNATTNDRGVFGIRYEHNNLGQLTAMWNIDSNGNVMAASNGVAAVLMSYDASGNLHELRNVNVDGKMVVGKNSTAGRTYEYDAEGRCVKKSFLDAAGSLCANSEGVATMRYAFSPDGLTEWAYFDVTGGRAADSDGVSFGRQGYDANGRCEWIVHFGKDGRPLADKDSAPRAQFGYDSQGRVASIDYTDMDGKALPDCEGVSGLRMEYDETGCVVRRSPVKADGGRAIPESSFEPRSKGVPDGWLEDLYAAKQLARKEGKLILLVFSGSDWCHWSAHLCKQLEANKTFLDKLRARYVLVMIDSPSNTSRLSKGARIQNQDVVSEYPHNGIPSVRILNPDGQVKRVLSYDFLTLSPPYLSQLFFEALAETDLKCINMACFPPIIMTFRRKVLNQDCFWMNQ